MEKVLAKLINSGLQEYESKAYYALAVNGNLTAKEISQKADIPLTKVYTTLSKLIGKGLCIKVPGHKKNYKALQPRVAFSCFVNEIKDKQSSIEQMVLELEGIYKSDNKTIDSYIEVLTNNDQIHEKYISLESDAKTEMISFVKPPYAHEGNRSKIERQEDVEVQNLRDGIVSKTIYEIPGSENALMVYKHIEKSVAAGEEARMLESVPLKLHVFDKRYVFMALNNSDNSSPELTMLAIEHPDLAAAHIILFENLWEKAIPYEEFKANNLELNYNENVNIDS